MYVPPFALRNGYAMTIYAGLRARQIWEDTVHDPEPSSEQIFEHIFSGEKDVPLFSQVALPLNPKATIIATYGITGNLDDQWQLQLLRRKALARGYAVVLFDWRAHGKTAELSPTLTSDGLYEGKDFVKIAAQSKPLGCPAPFWFTGFSLGGQLALWGIKTAQTLNQWIENPERTLGISEAELAGGAVICPSLDSTRSLRYLANHPLGQYLERAITGELKKLAHRIATYHPGIFDIEALERVNSIWSFDHELIIQSLGFSSVEEYYAACSPLPFLAHLEKPTYILYAADDPLFDPGIAPELPALAAKNPNLQLTLTPHGGHVGYISNQSCQRQMGDPDRWWAWNRILDWFEIGLV
ncbi:MAG: YheT family hydrolase [Microcoleaceae cyanobacterium]